MSKNTKQTTNARGVLVSAGVTNLYRDNVSGIYYLRAKINGTPFLRSLETTTKTQAVELLPVKLAELRTQLKQGIKVNDDMTFGDCLDKFMESKTEQHRIGQLDPTSLDLLQWTLKKLYAKWGTKIREEKVRKLAFEDFEKKHNDLHTEVSATYVNTIRQILVGALQVAVDAKIVTDNFMKKLHTKSNKIAPKEIPQTDEQLNKLLNHITRPSYSNAKKWHIRNLIEFFCWFGPRVKETKFLKKADVNLDLENEGADSHAPTIKFTETKNGEVKYLPIFPGAMPLVKALLADKTTGEKLLGASECLETLKNACRDLKFPKWTHHTFRHVFATRALIATNCDWFTVAHWMGHRDGGKLLAVRYAHLNQQHSQAQAKKLHYNFGKAAAPKPQTPAPVSQVVIGGQSFTLAQLEQLVKAQTASNIIPLHSAKAA